LFARGSEVKATIIFRITTQQLTFLKETARKVHPVEACALLFGKLTKKEASLERIVVTPNVLASSVRFEIDPQAFYDAFKEAEKDGLEFVGFFHSHPAPAHPSNIDLHFMQLWGDAVWLIFSSVDNNFGAFQFKNGEVSTLTLKSEGKFKE
jgi:proteasome lid subunit RPN8/RPN11